MILETVRIVSDWLGGSTYGLAPMLAAVTLDGSDTRPTVPAIYDETRNGPAARRKIPAKPSLVIRQTGEGAQLNGEPFPVAGPRDADVHLGVWYADSESASEIGNQGAHYVLRAAAQSLRLLTSSTGAAGAAAVTARNRNGIQLLLCKSLSLVTAYEPLEDGILLGAVLATYHVRDTNP